MVYSKVEVEYLGDLKMAQIELVSRESLAKENWWLKLEAKEQRVVLVETQALTEALVTYGMSRLAVGEHLNNLQAVLAPKKMFGKFLKTQCRFSVATAHRYIDSYLKTKDRIPEAILRTAIARGYDVIDAKVVDKLPPPKTEDREKIVTYLEKVESARKEARQITAIPDYDSEVMKKEVINFIGLRYDRLPANPRLRQKWASEVIGMMLFRFKMKSSEFDPIEIPVGFQVVRGRPRVTAA
jgi:hypothetical protein